MTRRGAIRLCKFMLASLLTSCGSTVAEPARAKAPPEPVRVNADARRTPPVQVSATNGCEMDAADDSVEVHEVDGRILHLTAAGHASSRNHADVVESRCSVPLHSAALALEKIVGEYDTEDYPCLSRGCHIWFRGLCSGGNSCSLLRIDAFCLYGNTPRLPIVLSGAPPDQHCAFAVDLDRLSAVSCAAEPRHGVASIICEGF